MFRPLLRKFVREPLFKRTLCSFGNIKYTNTNEWIRLSKENKNLARIGISQQAADNLSDIVYVEIEKKNVKLFQGNDFGALESVKAISDINMPVDGTIIKTNEDVIDDPSLINNSAEDLGWIAEIELTKESNEQFNELLDKDPAISE